MNCLGIDLGTANTYVYRYAPGALPQPVAPRGLADASGSIATAVMYEGGRAVLAGNIAEGEFYSQPGLQGGRRLACQFKPELALAEPYAMAAATDFLRLLLEALPVGLLLPQTVVTVGMPALAREDYRINLRRCFADAGWPAPEFAREPDAALVSCLQAGALNVEDLSRKCLIFDFGGGTCDYTTVANLDVLQNGGDSLYGGRLFDDLFYQAFCRANADFAREAPLSPYSWHAHWLECRSIKEEFSDFMRANADANAGTSLRIAWHDAKGRQREAFLHDYGRDEFMADAENYAASPELLAMLAPYASRGGLSAHARDLLAGRKVGLISWLRAIFESVEDRRHTSRVILTGGSSRWFFAPLLVEELFPAARMVESARGYEDIAFGLAMYPALKASRKRAESLLNEKLDDFARQCVALANGLVEKQARETASLLSRRIVERDVMPALEAAAEKSVTAAQLEAAFSANIADDAGLVQIAEKAGENLRNEIQSGLNFAFRRWLNENGVPLAPAFEFPAGAIGRDFFEGVSVKISRLDSLNIMAFTLQNIVPILAGTATAITVGHSGEPVSTAIGGGAAFGLTWLLARTAPKLLENRKLPSFFLNQRNREKIAASNREHIETALLKSFDDLRGKLALDIERRLRDALAAMLGGLSALNQAQSEIP